MTARLVNTMILALLVLGALAFWLCVVEVGRRVR